MLRFCADGNNPGDKKSGIKAEQTTVKSRFYTVNFPYFSKIILSPLPQITDRQPTDLSLVFLSLDHSPLLPS